MPVSRKRRPRRPSRTRRDRRRPRSTSPKVVETTIADMIEQGPSENDWYHLTKSLEAGANGDIAAALEHELSGTIIVESTHRFAVKDLLDLGDAAPAWAYSRWCLDLAYRSMLCSGDHSVADAAVKLTLVELHPSSLERAWDDPRARLVLGTQIAGGDPVAADLALFDLGGLRHYLENVARPGLLDRTDRIHEWADAQMGVYAYREMRGCRLVLTDVVTHREVEVLNIGAMSGIDDDHLVGRLVPISAEPGWMFASRPIPVAEPTALLVADAIRSGEPNGWLHGLGAALNRGHQHEQFHCVSRSPFTSDLPFLSPDDDFDALDDAPRTAELRSKGHSEHVANALGVLEFALIAVEVGDNTAAIVTPHVTAALTTPGAFEAAKVECTSPESASGWEVLAGVVPEHVAEMCRQLGERARSAASSRAPDLRGR